jgi:8-oxo-dGTP pyrophosphatase MutT (NUDIX family)
MGPAGRVGAVHKTPQPTRRALSSRGRAEPAAAPAVERPRTRRPDRRWRREAAPEGHSSSVRGASALVAARDEHDRLLLVRRRDSGHWELSGGRVGVGESAVDAAVRETTEEAGVRVQIEGLVGLSPFLHISCGSSAVRSASSSWCASGPGPAGADLGPTWTRRSMRPGSILRRSRLSMWNPRWADGSSRPCPGTPSPVSADACRLGAVSRAASS